MAETPIVVPAVPAGPSKGIQTTEFALTAVINAAGLVGVLSGHVSPTIYLLVVGGINVLYGIMRTFIKIFDPSYNIPALPDAIKQ